MSLSPSPSSYLYIHTDRFVFVNGLGGQGSTSSPPLSNSFRYVYSTLLHIFERSGTRDGCSHTKTCMCASSLIRPCPFPRVVQLFLIIIYHKIYVTIHSFKRIRCLFFYFIFFVGLTILRLEHNNNIF